MAISPAQKLILYALGQFYNSVNQPLIEKPVRVRTSKIAFIELLRQLQLVTKKERAMYQNLEMLEKNKLIAYNNRMITLTEKGLKQLGMAQKEISRLQREVSRMEHEIRPFVEAESKFQKLKPQNMGFSRKLQTVMDYR